MSRCQLSSAGDRTKTAVWLAFTLFFLLVAPGCRGRRYATTRSPSGPTSGQAQPAQSIGGGTVVAHGAPREQLEQFDGVMRQASYEPVAGAIEGNLTPEQQYASYPLDARRNQCYAVAVFGAPGQDVNLFLLDPRGGQAAFNVLPDEHPWIAFCAVRGGRFFLRVQGSGAFFLAAYQAEGRRPVDLHAFFQQATPESQVATLDGTTQARITAVESQLSGERYSRVGEPSGFVMGEHEDRRFALGLERGRCYAFGSFAGEGATDVDVQVTDSTGRTVADDSAGTRDALVRVCAEEAGTYHLNVRLPHGRGPVFTVAYVQAAAPTAGTPTPPTTPTAPLLASSAGGGLDENFALLDADMRVRGYEVLSTPTRGQLTAPMTFPVSLSGDNCYALLAVADAGVRRLSISLHDPSGREVDRDDSGSVRPTVRVCAPSSGSYELRLAAAEGSGSFVLASYHWPRGTRGPFGLSGLTFVRLAEMNALLEAEGFQPDPSTMPVQGRVTRGGESSHTISLAGGQCYSILVAGGEGVRDLDATMMRGTNTVESDTSTRGSVVSLRHCVGQDASFDLRVRAVDGQGPYVFQVFTRSNAE